MIDKATALETVLEKLTKLPVGHCLELRTYKRNRSVLFRMHGPDELFVREDGFHREDFQTDLKKVRKLLKTMLKREFPRSRKIRLYNIGPCGKDYSPRQMKNL